MSKLEWLKQLQKDIDAAECRDMETWCFECRKHECGVENHNDGLWAADYEQDDYLGASKVLDYVISYFKKELEKLK